MRTCCSCGRGLNSNEPRWCFKYENNKVRQQGLNVFIEGFYNEEDQNKKKASEFCLLCEDCLRNTSVNLGISEGFLKKLIERFKPIDVECEFVIE